MKSNHKRAIIGYLCAIIMSPLMIAGLVYHCVSAYFKAGIHMAKVSSEYLDIWINGWTKHDNIPCYNDV